MFVVEYIVRGRKSLYHAKRVIKRSIIEVEDEILERGDEVEDGKQHCCEDLLVEKATDGEIHLHLYWVRPNWEPGQVYELMLRDKLRQEGCELELVPSVPTL